MSNLAVIGDSTSVMGFRALGVDVYAFDDVEEMRSAFPEILRGDRAVIFITEVFYEAVGDMVGTVKDAIKPAVVPIPGVSGSTGAARRGIDKLIEMAVGVQIKK